METRRIVRIYTDLFRDQFSQQIPQRFITWVNPGLDKEEDSSLNEKGKRKGNLKYDDSIRLLFSNYLQSDLSSSVCEALYLTSLQYYNCAQSLLAFNKTSKFLMFQSPLKLETTE